MPSSGRADNEKDQKPCYVPKRSGCTEPHCKEDALSFKSKCWFHLNSTERSEYVEEIVRRAKDESLVKAMLLDVDLHSVDLRDADLRGADLGGANLQGSILVKADLEGAWLVLANLERTILMDTNLRNAYIVGVQWEGARFLTHRQIGKTADYSQGEWAVANEEYRQLKAHFHDGGCYEDEAWAFIMEKTCARNLAKEQKRYGAWIVLWAWNLLAGYGEKWWRAVYWAIGIIAFFASAFFWGQSPLRVTLDYGQLDPKSLLTAFYFSVVTFATLGFGDIHPIGSGGMIAVIVEVALGYLLLGTVVALVARKMTR